MFFIAELLAHVKRLRGMLETNKTRPAIHVYSFRRSVYSQPLATKSRTLSRASNNPIEFRVVRADDDWLGRVQFNKSARTSNYGERRARYEFPPV